MTVTTAYVPERFDGDGTTVLFAVDWEFIEETTLVVQLVSNGTVVDQVLNSDYTVQGGLGEKGSVTMVVPPAVGETLLISRLNPRTQLLDLETNQDLPAESLERAYDRGTMIDQEISEDQDRDLTMELLTPPEFDADVPYVPDSYVKINAAGTGFEPGDGQGPPGPPGDGTIKVVETDQDQDFLDPKVVMKDFGGARTNLLTKEVTAPSGDAKLELAVQAATDAEAQASASDDVALTPKSALQTVYATAKSRSINRLQNSIEPYVQQRGASIAGVTSGQFGWDRWRNGGSAGVLDADTFVDANGKQWMRYTVQTALSSPGPTDLRAVQQRMEADVVSDFRCGHSNAETVTLAFEHNFPVAGDYGVRFTNAAQDRSYIGIVTQSSAGADEEAVLTVPMDVAGTWVNYGNTTGLEAAICLVAGDSYKGLEDQWQAGNLFTTSAQVNALATVGNQIKFGNLRLGLGEAPPPIIAQSWSEKLSECERMYQKTFHYNVTPANAAGANGAPNYRSPIAGIATRSVAWTLSTKMRTTPSIVMYNPGAGAGATFRNLNLGTDSGAGAVDYASEREVMLRNPQAAGDRQDDPLAIHATADAEL